MQYVYRITTIMKVEKDIIVTIVASPIGRVAILVIIIKWQYFIYYSSQIKSIILPRIFQCPFEQFVDHMAYLYDNHYLFPGL